MNQRVPESSGLPLRAGVMVFLFSGVLFLLLGIQKVGTGASSSEQATPVVTTTTTTTTTAATTAPAKPAVHVYNLTQEQGLAGTAANELNGQGWNATAVQENPEGLPSVERTTVFYTADAPGEKEAADQVAAILHNAVVAVRGPELEATPAGLIVLVTG